MEKDYENLKMNFHTRLQKIKKMPLVQFWMTLQEEPMDRVICGDVGFGKTEVAMRATLIATLNHKQVVVLAPTTLRKST